MTRCGALGELRSPNTPMNPNEPGRSRPAARAALARLEILEEFVVLDAVPRGGFTRLTQSGAKGYGLFDGG